MSSGAPSLGLWAAELLDLPGLLASPALPGVAMASGDGQPVMVLPGYLTGDISSVRLRRSLRRAGYAAEGWGLGQNRGARHDLLDRLAGRVRALSDAHGRKVSLIGWSLGGVFAREVAKLEPQRIALVVTLGSPFSGDLRANNAWRIYELLNDHPVDRPPLSVTLNEKPPVRTVAIWSRRDGIVAPSAARGLPQESDRQVEVGCRHLGFARTPEGIRAIGKVLAEELPA